MDTMKLWARNGDTVRQTIELGEFVHLDTASEELPLGYSVEVLEPSQGLSRRGTAEDKLSSGDVLHTLLVKLENHVDLSRPLRLPPVEPNVAVKVRKRASRRAVQGAGDVAEAEARAQRAAAALIAWDNAHVGPSL